MKAALFDSYDGPAAVHLGEAPQPEPGPGEVRVRVHAASLNNSDLQSSRGGYGKPALPHIVGQEGAGIVDSLGEGVTGLTPGDRVVGRVRKACAEYAVGAATELLPLPESIPFEVAASLPVAYLTAAMALVQKANVQSGEWVLISPGSGAVGSAAIQLARFLGATVIATAGSDEKLDKLRAMGAHHALNYTADDLAARVRALTGDTGVQVALDGGGRITFAQALDALANNGRIAIYGYVTGMDAALPIGKLLLRNAAVYGYAIWTNKDYRATMDTLRDVVLPAVADGRITSVVEEVVELEAVGEALQRMADRKLTGKVVVRV